MLDKPRVHRDADHDADQPKIDKFGGTPHLPEPELFPTLPPLSSQSNINWRLRFWIAFGLLVIIIMGISGWLVFSDSPNYQTETGQFRITISPSPIISTVPTPAGTAIAAAPTSPPSTSTNVFSFIEATITPTPVPDGEILLLRPAAASSGWVVSNEESNVTIYDAQNHFGDSFLYAGVLNAQVYHGAFQFDLGGIPRGSEIVAASLRLTGLRSNLLAEGADETWRVQLLASELDYYWSTVNYQQIHKASAVTTLNPTLSQSELGVGQINEFYFTPEQLALLERRIFEGAGKVSFRIDGPMEGTDNLFAWDTGYGSASQQAGPELFLSVGPPPLETPLPFYVVVTSTPTPENIMTAAAFSLKLTAEATRVGTSTPVPPNWATPVVVTSVPTPENQATAQALSQQATAIALTTGEPINIITTTPTPTNVVVTSTPTPEDIMTAIANSLRMTAEATRIGTATALPSNWVTPLIVTATPTPANNATVEYWQAAALATGTATPLPDNAQTATPTPTYVVITSTPTPENIITEVANSRQATAAAIQIGTATPLPANWVTPVVVTATPTPVSSATAEYWQAVVLVTGTPTPLPVNVQTATPTPVFVTIEPILSPTPTVTPTPARPVPPSLVGKILFLSDREAGAVQSPSGATSSSIPSSQNQFKVYVFDPETGQLGRLTDTWPYDVALARDIWSADGRFRVFTKDAIRNALESPQPPEIVPELYVFDYLYKVEWQLTKFGAGIAWGGVWSPTRNEIAFISSESRDDEIWVVNSDGSNIRRLTSTNEAYNAREIGKDTFIPEINKRPSWSPDGEQIVFYSNRTGNNQIWIMNKDGTEQRLLMDWNPYSDWDPVWVKYPDPPPPLVQD